MGYKCLPTAIVTLAHKAYMCSSGILNNAHAMGGVRHEKPNSIQGIGSSVSAVRGEVKGGGVADHNSN